MEYTVVLPDGKRIEGVMRINYPSWEHPFWIFFGKDEKPIMATGNVTVYGDFKKETGEITEEQYLGSEYFFKTKNEENAD